MVENALTVSLESFVIIPFASTVRSKSLREPVNMLHHFFLLPIYQQKQDPYQISFLNLTKTFILLNFRVAIVNFVHEVLECKDFLKLDTARLLACNKLRTDP